MTGEHTPYPKVLVTRAMTQSVASISGDEPAVEAANRLTDEGIGSLLVDGDGTPAGIITESDFTRLVAEGHDPTETPVSECMSTPVVTINTETTLERAAELLREHNIKKLPVVDGEEIVGILTTTDMAKYLPSHKLPQDD